LKKHLKNGDEVFFVCNNFEIFKGKIFGLDQKAKDISYDFYARVVDLENSNNVFTCVHGKWFKTQEECFNYLKSIIIELSFDLNNKINNFNNFFNKKSKLNNIETEFIGYEDI
jgi:hypothetical protein